MIETSRLKIYAATQSEMEKFIELQTIDVLKAAYQEMLEGCLQHPDKWDWYAIWMIELKDGTHIGELCFKGIDEKGTPEIGYGISEEYQNYGYATEAVKAVVEWAFRDENVISVEAETEDDNEASKKVLKKCGFVANGKRGEEGARYEVLKNKNDYIIRPERKEEYREVEYLVRESFWNVYRPGCLEHYVLNQLRNDKAFVPELDFVMEKDGKIIGQNMFMRAVIKADDGRDIPIMTMGPICVAPEFKRQGYGKKLLDYSLEQAAELGCGALCFEGNINFYGKSGFTFASEFGIRYHGLPEDADASFFLCKELIPGYLNGVTGEYATPQGYFVDEEEAEEFDKAFPYKEKLKLPGQLWV